MTPNNVEVVRGNCLRGPRDHAHTVSNILQDQQRVWLVALAFEIWCGNWIPPELPLLCWIFDFKVWRCLRISIQDIERRGDSGRYSIPSPRTRSVIWMKTQPGGQLDFEGFSYVVGRRLQWMQWWPLPFLRSKIRRHVLLHLKDWHDQTHHTSIYIQSPAQDNHT